MLISMSGSNFARTTAQKRIERAICSLLSGFQTSSWGELKPTKIGLSCAQMNVLDYSSAGERNLKSFTPNTRKKREAEKPWRPNGFGAKSLTPKSKPEPHTCFTRTTATESLTKTIWERSRVQTCALRLWNILTKMRLPFVIWHQFPSQSLQITKAEPSIMKPSTKWQKESRKISIK